MARVHYAHHDRETSAVGHACTYPGKDPTGGVSMDSGSSADTAPSIHACVMLSNSTGTAPNGAVTCTYARNSEGDNGVVDGDGVGMCVGGAGVGDGDGDGDAVGRAARPRCMADSSGKPWLASSPSTDHRARPDRPLSHT